MNAGRYTYRLVGIASCMAFLVALTGCTTTQQGTGAGAAVGAALGGIVGNNLGSGAGDRDKGALLGAGVGALVGNQIGTQKQRNQDLERRVQATEQNNRRTQVWITNSNGSRTPIELRRGTGGTWIGPRNEVYMNMPGEQQLKSVYGF